MSAVPDRRARREPDARLIARVAAGDVGALGQLYDHHAEAVRRVVARLGASPADVDDLTHATFLDLLAAASRYDGRSDARPWIIGMAVVQVRRHRRSLARLAARIASWGREPRPMGDTTEAAAALRQMARRAQAALERLSPKKREVFVLVALEGLAGEQVAASLGIPVATVWTRLHHARLELRAALAEEVP